LTSLAKWCSWTIFTDWAVTFGASLAFWCVIQKAEITLKTYYKIGEHFEQVVALGHLIHPVIIEEQRVHVVESLDL
jgi:hypothetical protein